jgi:hypothetical protein
MAVPVHAVRLDEAVDFRREPGRTQLCVLVKRSDRHSVLPDRNVMEMNCAELNWTGQRSDGACRPINRLLSHRAAGGAASLEP